MRRATPIIRVVDYGVGNVFSVRSALARLSNNVEITQDPNELRNASHIVLPGVGTYDFAMSKIRQMNLEQSLQDFVKNGNALLGICLGMQILSTIGYENGEHAGLNLVPGTVRSLGDRQSTNRLPNIGWRKVFFNEHRESFMSNSDSDYYYFAHSYELHPQNANHVVATSAFGLDKFVAAIQVENICGVQFHPEKSGKSGLQFLQRFVESR